MKNYELNFLINPDLSESEDVRVIQDEISSFIKESGGSLEKIHAVAKKDLGYEIGGKNQAYLAIINFSLGPEKVSEIEKKIKELKEVMRYVFLAKPPKESKPEKIEEKTTESKAPAPKVELGDIDKKIDEILNV